VAEQDEPAGVGAVTGTETGGEPDADAATQDVAAGALAPLRERIDAIDREIVALLNERARIALEIGHVKQVSGRRTVRDARREEQVIEHVTSVSAGLLPDPELVALYRRLIAATRRVQHAQRRRGPDTEAAAVDKPGLASGTAATGAGPATDPPPDHR
jgi:chorismate mutase/prephenate dehydratase